jgi:cell wall-associated NlpC family hydrolase
MPYIWGGNSPIGSLRMLDLYPTNQAIDDLTRAKWTMAGFDCSGLLFWATDGYTPRNTSKLMMFGTGLDIE